MTSPTHSYRALRASPLSPAAGQKLRTLLSVVATAAVLSTCAAAVLAFPPASRADQSLDAYVAANAQSVSVPVGAAETAVTRDAFTMTTGFEMYSAGGTNHDWAKLVLVYAGWPVSDNNVTVLTRWMRQENGADDWYNRNNPLNIGAGGFASYPDLQTSAQVVAKALSTSSGYREIAAAFAASADPAVTEYAIWASPWAGGHYAWGGHWHYTPVEVVSAPSGAWGR